jgi:hypothetical protein
VVQAGQLSAPASQPSIGWQSAAIPAAKGEIMTPFDQLLIEQETKWAMEIVMASLNEIRDERWKRAKNWLEKYEAERS